MDQQTDLLTMWIIMLNPLSGFIKLFLVPVGAPQQVYQSLWNVLCCLQDGSHQITLAVNWP